MVQEPSSLLVQVDILEPKSLFVSHAKVSGWRLFYALSGRLGEWRVNSHILVSRHYAKLELGVIG